MTLHRTRSAFILSQVSLEEKQTRKQREMGNLLCDFHRHVEIDVFLVAWRQEVGDDCQKN